MPAVLQLIARAAQSGASAVPEPGLPPPDNDNQSSQ